MKKNEMQEKDVLSKKQNDESKGFIQFDGYVVDDPGVDNMILVESFEFENHADVRVILRSNIDPTDVIRILKCLVKWLRQEPETLKEGPFLPEAYTFKQIEKSVKQTKKEVGQTILEILDESPADRLRRMAELLTTES